MRDHWLPCTLHRTHYGLHQLFPRTIFEEPWVAKAFEGALHTGLESERSCCLPNRSRCLSNTCAGAAWALRRRSHMARRQGTDCETEAERRERSRDSEWQRLHQRATPTIVPAIARNSDRRWQCVTCVPDAACLVHGKGQVLHRQAPFLHRNALLPDWPVDPILIAVSPRAPPRTLRARARAVDPTPILVEAPAATTASSASAIALVGNGSEVVGLIRFHAPPVETDRGIRIIPFEQVSGNVCLKILKADTQFRVICAVCTG